MITPTEVFPNTTEDLTSFFYQVEKECQSVGLAIQGNSFTINSRLKRSLGRCSKLPKTSSTQTDRFLIEINPYVLETQNVSLLRNVIAHELIHTIRGCYNHGILFKQAAQKLNSFYPSLYKIQVYLNLADYGLTPPSQTFNYVIECKKCHSKIYRQRMCDTIRYLDRYCCPQCHGPLKVYEIHSKQTPK